MRGKGRNRRKCHRKLEGTPSDFHKARPRPPGSPQRRPGPTPRRRGSPHASSSRPSPVSFRLAGLSQVGIRDLRPTCGVGRGRGWCRRTAFQREMHVRRKASSVVGEGLSCQLDVPPEHSQGSVGCCRVKAHIHQLGEDTGRGQPPLTGLGCTRPTPARHP